MVFTFTWSVENGQEKQEGGSWGFRMADFFVIFYERYITEEVSQKEPNPCVNSHTQNLYKRKIKQP